MTEENGPNGRRNCVGITKLDGKFDSLIESNKEMKALLEKINDRQQTHYNDLVRVQENVLFIKNDIKGNKKEHRVEIQELKKEHEKDIQKIWDEFRRRQRNFWWSLTIIVPAATGVFTVIVTSLIAYFSKG